MSRRIDLCYKGVALLLALVMMIPVLAACDDDENDDPLTPTGTAAPTATAASTGPVKIGSIQAFSGAYAMAGLMAKQATEVIEAYVEQNGGILGGRPLEIITCDSGGEVARATSCVTKLVTGDEISAVVGGGSAAEMPALSDFAEKYELLYPLPAGVPLDLSALEYTIRATASPLPRNDLSTRFILEDLQPRTIAFLSGDDTNARYETGLKAADMENAGVEVVYSQHTAVGIADFSPYLTQIKRHAPDVVAMWFGDPTTYSNIFTQITALGGWGDIQIVCTSGGSGFDFIPGMDGAAGTYHYLTWTNGLPYPESQMLEQLFMEVLGQPPNAIHLYSWFELMPVLAAIELAGSDDPKEIAQAARSGNLVWDSPLGPAMTDTDGESNYTGVMAVVEDGKFVALEKYLP